MSEPFEELAGLDRLIHEPARLAVLTALESCEQADFLFLRRLTGLTKGNLSAHLARLEEAGFVEIEKAFVGKKPRTTIRLSTTGRAAITQYWDRLERLRKRSRAWEADES